MARGSEQSWKRRGLHDTPGRTVESLMHRLPRLRRLFAGRANLTSRARKRLVRGGPPVAPEDPSQPQRQDHPERSGPDFDRANEGPRRDGWRGAIRTQFLQSALSDNGTLSQRLDADRPCGYLKRQDRRSQVKVPGWNVDRGNGFRGIDELVVNDEPGMTLRVGYDRGRPPLQPRADPARFWQ